MKHCRGFIFLDFTFALPLLAVVGLIVVVALTTYTKTHAALREQTLAFDRAHQVLLDLQSGRISLDTPPPGVVIERLASPQPQLRWVRVRSGKIVSLIGAIPAEASP